MKTQQNMGFSDVLATSRIIVCCGSGGVGKTTTAAAMAIQAAQLGRRVVLITIDPAKRLADALGLSELSNEPRRVERKDAPFADGGELWAMMLDARATFDHLIVEHSRSEQQAQAILNNPFYSNIASRLSGSQEYMAAEKLYGLFHDQRFDVVIVDTPPTREALDFLQAPQKLMSFLDHRLYRWLVAPARGGLRVLNFAAQPILRIIGRVIGADVLADAINFFQSFEGIEEGFHNRAEATQSLLASSDSKYVIVASAREDTIQEAVFFTRQLASLATPVTGLVINRLQPSFGTGSANAAMTASRTADKEGQPDVAILQRNMAHLRRIVQAEEATLAPLLEAVGSATVVRLYQRAQDVHDLEAIADLGRDLVASVPTR